MPHNPRCLTVLLCQNASDPFRAYLQCGQTQTVRCVSCVMRLPDACGMVVPIDGGNVEESCLHGAYVQDVANRHRSLSHTQRDVVNDMKPAYILIHHDGLLCRLDSACAGHGWGAISADA